MEITSSLRHTRAFYAEAVDGISFYIRRERRRRIRVFSNTGCAALLESNGRFINIRLSMPQKYMSQTSGMMGNFNGVAGDDTTTPREFCVDRIIIDLNLNCIMYW